MLTLLVSEALQQALLFRLVDVVEGVTSWQLSSKDFDTASPSALDQHTSLPSAHLPCCCLSRQDAFLEPHREVH